MINKDRITVLPENINKHILRQALKHSKTRAKLKIKYNYNEKSLKHVLPQFSTKKEIN